jgi:hypothetical protein
LTAAEHAASVSQLRAEYASALDDLGLDPDDLPDPADEDDAAPRGKGEQQARFRIFSGLRNRARCPLPSNAP